MCEICFFLNSWKVEMPPGPGGRLRRLNSITKMVLEEKPPPIPFNPAPLREASLLKALGKKAKAIWNTITGKARRDRKRKALRERQERALADAAADEEVPYSSSDSESSSSSEDNDDEVAEE